MKYKSLAELFLTKAQRFGEKVLVRYFKRPQRELQELTWIEVLEKVEKVSLGLERLGAKPKENIGLLAITCHDWLVCDFAILCMGACTVPLYHNSSEETIEHITIHASLRYVLVRNKIQLQKLRANFHKFPLLEYVIVIEDKGDIPRNEPKIITLDDVIRIGEQEKKKHPDKFRENIKAIQPDDLATIIYTSGTTGIPKGVPLTHKNVLIAALSFFEYVPLGEQHVQLTFLPLAHVFERICGQIYGIDQGVIFTYSEQAEQIPYLLKNADITMMLVVPRILEKIYAKVMNEISKQPEMVRKTIRAAIDFGVEFQKKRANKKPVTFLENLAYSVAKSTILNKIKQNIAPKLSIFLTGGAPLSSEISFFFEALGITVLEGYGLTETTAPLTANPLLANKPGTVGIPFGHFKVKIADDGEIICQGAALFQGYYKDGKRENEYKSWYPTGQLLEHMIYDKDGTDEYKMWYENEQIWMHMYSKGDKREGEYKRWDEDGKLMVQKFYKDGKEEGECKEWHPNGQLDCQGYYKEGKLEGEFKSWDKYGQMLEHIIYDNEGKIVKLKRYHNCGVLDIEKTLIENDTYELTRYYVYDGKIHDRVIMVGDKWNGEYNSWWRNGNKCIETTYKDHKLHGNYLYWNEDGTLKEKCFYKDGEKQV
ncbi:MAG: hypothetical protein EBR67_09345 [Proteobacteria bacterium]|nr:hypothetical protein [Pseudomonadota bacterium]